MSENITTSVEQEFNSIRKSLDAEQWNDPLFIRDLSVEYETTNVTLAYRLMQRAHNLKPEGEVIKSKLAAYSEKIKQESPDFFKGISSTQNRQLEEITENRINFDTMKAFLRSHFSLCVILPVFVFFVYQAIIASERYESTAMIVIKQPDNGSSISPELAVLGSFGVPTADNDSRLLESYIYSADMLSYLDEKLDLKSHYASGSVDYFSRLANDSSVEDFIEYYKEHVVVNINDLSGIIELRVQGFEPEYAKLISEEIILKSESFINSIGYQLAAEQVKFMSNEHVTWQKNLKEAQNQMLAYQQKYKLLDPLAEGTALQSISYNLESQIATIKAQLIASQTLMADTAPEVQTLKNQLAALEGQLLSEKSRLAIRSDSEVSVSEIIAQFAALKIDYEMATQAYTASLASLEKAKVDAYRQIKYLVTIEKPTLPEENKYPQVLYNVTLLAIILSLLFGITKIVVATIKELN